MQTSKEATSFTFSKFRYFLLNYTCSHHSNYDNSFSNEPYHFTSFKPAPMCVDFIEQWSKFLGRRRIARGSGRGVVDGHVNGGKSSSSDGGRGFHTVISDSWQILSVAVYNHYRRIYHESEHS